MLTKGRKGSEIFETLTYNIESCPSDVANKCSEIFSNHYGKWSDNGHKPGQPVSYSENRWKKELFHSSNCYVSVCSIEGLNVIIGFLTFKRFKYNGQNYVWATQLCVNKTYRSKGLAKLLIKTILPANFVGVVSSHPFAIKACERIVESKINKQFMQIHIQNIIKKSQIQYLQNKTITINDTKSIINTEFYIDHEEINKSFKLLKEKNIKWEHGEINEGEEYLLLLQLRGWKSYQKPKKIAIASSIAISVISGVLYALNKYYGGDKQKK